MANNLTFNRTSSVFYSCFDEDLSSTEVTPERWTTPDSESSLATGIVLLIYIILGIPLSLFLIISILYKKLYKQPTHIVFLALIFNDLFICLTYIPINIISAFAGEFIFGNDDVTRCHVCQTGVIFVIFIHINLFLVALLSIDRFIFIRFPMYYPRLVTVKSTIVVILIITVFGVAVSVPPLFGFGEIRFTHSISTCSIYLLGSTKLTRNINYEIFSIAVSLSGPGVILLVTNVWLILIIQKQLKKLYKIDKSNRKAQDPEKAQEQNAVVKARNKKQLQLVKVFGGILIVNLVTWFPDILNVAVLLALNKQYFNIPHGFFVINYLLFSSQVLLHPLLKIYLIPDIRNIIKKSFGKRLRKRRETLILSRSNSVFAEENKHCDCFDKLSAALLYRNTSLTPEAATAMSSRIRSSVSSYKPSVRNVESCSSR